METKLYKKYLTGKTVATVWNPCLLGLSGYIEEVREAKSSTAHTEANVVGLEFVKEARRNKVV